MENDKHLLLKIWNSLGFIGGLLSLSSLSDSIVQTKGFISDIIIFYHTWFHSIFYKIFAWLPFDISPFFIDYFILGVITVSAKAPHDLDLREILADGSIITIIIFLLYYFFISSLFWPFFILFGAIHILSYRTLGKEDKNTKEYLDNMDSGQRTAYVIGTYTHGRFSIGFYKNILLIILSFALLYSLSLAFI